jgi:hypothetical protein
MNCIYYCFGSRFFLQSALLNKVSKVASLQTSFQTLTPFFFTDLRRISLLCGILSLYLSWIYQPVACSWGWKVETERVDVAGSSILVFRRCLVRMSAGASIFLKEVFRGFLIMCRKMGGLISRTGLGHLIPDPFQIIIHQSSYHLMLYTLVIESIIYKVGLCDH